MNSPRRLAFTFAAALLLLAACGGTAAPPAANAGTSSAGAAQTAKAPDKLTMAYTAVTYDQVPPMVAKEQGFFEQNGLDVNLLSIGTGSNPVAAMISGQLQAYQGGTEALLATLGGTDLVYVAAPSTTIQFWLDAQPSITTGDQLKGKQVAVTSLGSASHTAARMALRSLQLDPNNDVVFTAVNTPPTILAALLNGAVQAGSIGTPNIAAARKAGMHELVDVAALNVPYPNAWTIMSKAYIQAHPDVTQRYVRSIVQGIAFELQHPAETQQILGKYAQSNDTQYLKDMYDMVTPHARKVPLPDVDGVRNALQELSGDNPKAATADPASFVDARFVQTLNDSGFIASLYQ